MGVEMDIYFVDVCSLYVWKLYVDFLIPLKNMKLMSRWGSGIWKINGKKYFFSIFITCWLRCWGCCFHVCKILHERYKVLYSSIYAYGVNYIIIIVNIIMTIKWIFKKITTNLPVPLIPDGRIRASYFPWPRIWSRIFFSFSRKFTRGLLALNIFFIHVMMSVMIMAFNCCRI